MGVDVLMKKGYAEAALCIQAECCRSSKPDNLNKLLDRLLDPKKDIDDSDTIEWIGWLMAGGLTPEEWRTSSK